jgi:hypothetical protein
MITAVAWNFASSLFQIRVYTTTYTDDLLEISFSRESGGWNNQSSELVSATIPETSSKATTPLSAVAAVRGECNGKIKVYFHPRRKVIAEWDVCDKTPIHAGITKVCEGAKERRRIEEETRRKIEEEEERKRQEAERRRREEEAAKVTVKITDVRVQEKMKKLSGCNQGYAWKKEKGGYRCEGGAHFITDEEFERG